MLNFFKHHWSKRERLLARWSALHLALAVSVGLLAALLLVLWQTGKDNVRMVSLRDTAQQVQPATEVPPGSKPIGGSFDLTNQDGKPVKDTDFRGKDMLIYFGYTYCPDMCPTGLQSMAKALDLLGKDADQVAPLFITIDPARDTADKLKPYVAQFHPKIQGLTGTDQQVARAAAAYQVYYAKGEAVDDHDYMMDHSSAIYLMDKDGKLIKTFTEDADPEEIAKAIKTSSAP